LVLFRESDDFAAMPFNECLSGYSHSLEGRGLRVKPQQIVVPPSFRTDSESDLIRGQFQTACPSLPVHHGFWGRCQWPQRGRTRQPRLKAWETVAWISSSRPNGPRLERANESRPVGAFWKLCAVRRPRPSAWAVEFRPFRAALLPESHQQTFNHDFSTAPEGSGMVRLDCSRLLVNLESGVRTDPAVARRLTD
jgi:hypothetical protein